MRTNPRKIDRSRVVEFNTQLGLDPSEVTRIKAEAWCPVEVTFTERSGKADVQLPFEDHRETLVEFVQDLGVNPELVRGFSVEFDEGVLRVRPVLDFFAR